MRNFLKAALMIAVLVLLPAGNTAAQPECTVEVTNVIAALETAQTAADEGDTEAALAEIEAAQAALAEIITTCSDVVLTESVTLAGELTVSYPADWTIDSRQTDSDEEGAFITIGNNPAAIESTYTTEPQMQAGGHVIGVFYGTLPQLNQIVDEPIVQTDSLDDQLIGIIEGVTSALDYAVGAPTFTSIGDRRVAVAELGSDTFSLQVFAVAVDRDESRFAVVLSVANPEEAATRHALAEKFVEALRYER